MGCLKLNIENRTSLRVLNGGKSLIPKSCKRTYWFGYNGMEKDPEMKGDGNSYTTEFRQYDPRLGRWLSLDPMMQMFPEMSPYVAFDNNPIYYIDPYGLSSEAGDGGSLEGDPPVKKADGSSYSVDDDFTDEVTGDIYRCVGLTDKGDAIWQIVERTNLEEFVTTAVSPATERAAEIAKATAHGYAWSITNNNLLGAGYVWVAITGLGDPTEMYEDDPVLLKAFYAGELAGDAQSIAQGLAEIEAGGGITLGSGGSLVLVGGGVAAHGATVVSVASAHTVYVGIQILKLANMNGGEGTESNNEGQPSSGKSSGKNGKHANEKARQVAKEKYEAAKKELDALKSKPNKTKDDKKLLIKLENQVKQLKKKADFTGENHNQNSKGTR